MAPIDTSFGQRAATSAINSQISRDIRAGQNIPQIKTFAGMPRR